MKGETENFFVRCKGLSSDLRTNVWEITCKACNKIHTPQTTMFATQTVECPKCGIREVINYNELKKE